MLAVYSDGQGQMLATTFDVTGAALSEPTVLGCPRGKPVWFLDRSHRSMRT